MAITENLETILGARYGREVRQAIHDGIKQAYDDAISNGHADMEVSQARGSYPTLVERLNETDNKQRQNDEQLAQKANQAFVDAQFSSIVSGAPKGTYTDLSALQSAYPNGAEGVFLVLSNGHWYYWNSTTSAWTDGGLYQSSGIADGSVTERKLTFLPIVGQKSKNLFDKSKVFFGAYVDYTNGTIASNASYSRTDYIAISSSTSYAISGTREQLAFYDATKKYISGLAIVPTNGVITTPANAYYMRMSMFTTQIDSVQVEMGSQKTEFESFGNKIDSNAYKNRSIELKKIIPPKNILVVAKSGGDYSTITAAVANANDTAENPVTILIMPGIYEESVYVGGNRHLSLVGVNKRECIIIDRTGLRDNAPIEISGDSYCANLTFYATFTDESVVINNLGSYGVHVDYAGEGTTEFYNCDIISDCSSAIGSGTLNNQTIIFNNCFIKSNAKSNYMSAWCYAVFLHGSGTASHINQHYVLKNCEIHGVQDRLLRLSHVGSDFDVTFINNMLWSDTIGKADNTVFFDDGVTITQQSYGNNVAILNK